MAGYMEDCSSFRFDLERLADEMGRDKHRLMICGYLTKERKNLFPEAPSEVMQLRLTWRAIKRNSRDFFARMAAGSLYLRLDHAGIPNLRPSLNARNSQTKSGL